MRWRAISFFTTFLALAGTATSWAQASSSTRELVSEPTGESPSEPGNHTSGEPSAAAFRFGAGLSAISANHAIPLPVSPSIRMGLARGSLGFEGVFEYIVPTIYDYDREGGAIVLVGAAVRLQSGAGERGLSLYGSLRVNRVFETAEDSSFTSAGPQVGLEYHWDGWGLFGEIGGAFGKTDTSFFGGGERSGFYPQFAMGMVVAAR